MISKSEVNLALDAPRRRNHKGKNRVNNKEMGESMGTVARSPLSIGKSSTKLGESQRPPHHFLLGVLFRLETVLDPSSLFLLF